MWRKSNRKNEVDGKLKRSGKQGKSGEKKAGRKKEAAAIGSKEEDRPEIPRRFLSKKTGSTIGIS